VTLLSLRDAGRVAGTAIPKFAQGRIVSRQRLLRNAGFWLAMKAASPIYIKRSVWDECATEIETDGGGTLDDALRNFRAIRFASQTPLLRKCPQQLDVMLAIDAERNKPNSTHRTGQIRIVTASLLVRCRLGPQGTLRADPEQELEGTALLTTVRGSDPEYIKRLKREMHVALRHALPCSLRKMMSWGAVGWALSLD
jgi:hypothetical protein